MNWKNFTNKQQLAISIFILLVSLLLIFSLFISPIFKKNNNLHSQIISAISVGKYLSNSQTKLQNNKIFPSITTKAAKKIIQNNFQAIKTIAIDKKNIKLTLKKQEFIKVINAISKLKAQHGIVVIFAKIDKIKSGIVSSELVLKHP